MRGLSLPPLRGEVDDGEVEECSSAAHAATVAAMMGSVHFGLTSHASGPVACVQGCACEPPLAAAPPRRAPWLLCAVAVVPTGCDALSSSLSASWPMLVARLRAAMSVCEVSRGEREGGDAMRRVLLAGASPKLRSLAHASRLALTKALRPSLTSKPSVCTSLSPCQTHSQTLLRAPASWAHPSARQTCPC